MKKAIPTPVTPTKTQYIPITDDWLIEHFPLTEDDWIVWKLGQVEKVTKKQLEWWLKRHAQFKNKGEWDERLRLFLMKHIPSKDLNEELQKDVANALSILPVTKQMKSDLPLGLAKSLALYGLAYRDVYPFVYDADALMFLLSKEADEAVRDEYGNGPDFEWDKNSLTEVALENAVASFRENAAQVIDGLRAGFPWTDIGKTRMEWSRIKRNEWRTAYNPIENPFGLFSEQLKRAATKLFQRAIAEFALLSRELDSVFGIPLKKPPQGLHLVLDIISECASAIQSMVSKFSMPGRAMGDQVYCDFPDGIHHLESRLSVLDGANQKTSRNTVVSGFPTIAFDKGEIPERLKGILHGYRHVPNDKDKSYVDYGTGQRRRKYHFAGAAQWTTVRTLIEHGNDPNGVELEKADRGRFSSHGKQSDASLFWDAAIAPVLGQTNHFRLGK